MRVAYIFPGSGGTFYCPNCIRDAFLVQALREIGHDVVVIPLYLPLFGHEDLCRADVPVFYGAVSLYLKHVFPFMQGAPRWISKLLDWRPVLGMAARRAGSTRASGLEDMTVSMLRGEAGGQGEELERLTLWLEEHFRPDVVHLSNALLLGLSETFRKRLGAAIVCSLQDEDQWVDAMGAEGAERVWSVMAERAAYVDAFVSSSNYYAGVMRDKLGLDEGLVDVVYPGVDPGKYVPAEVRPETPTLGYLSRLSRELGLDLVVDAFLMLREMKGLENLRLKAVGGRTGDDVAFLRSLERQCAARGALDDVEFITGFDSDVRAEFFDNISVLTVPVPNGEAFGIYLIEALAAGVPIVQPRAGSYTEIIEATGGGELYEPGGPAELAGALEPLLRDPARAAELGRIGRKKVMEGFTAGRMARQMVDIYGRVRHSEDTDDA